MLRRGLWKDLGHLGVTSTVLLVALTMAHPLCPPRLVAVSSPIQEMQVGSTPQLHTSEL